MIGGLAEMAEESPLFEKVKPYATGMAIYTGILYFFDMFGLSASLGVLSFILTIASTFISLYISYCIIKGVKDVEGKYNASLNGDRLQSTWLIFAVFNVVAIVLMLIPPAALVCIIVSFIAAICFLVAFNNSKNLYYKMKSHL
jgi:hypothetical protein